MKITTLKSVAIAVGLAAPAFGQATSNVVGYETLTLDQQFNTIGLRLVGKSDVVTTASVVAGADVTLDAVPPADASYVLEVTSGVASGMVVEVSTSGSIATATDDLEVAGVVAGDSLVLREAQTLDSVFGGALDASASAANADLVSVPDGTGGFNTYFFNPGGFGATATWQEITAAGNVDVDGSLIVLVYTDGMIVTNRGDDNTLIVAGEVKTTETSYALTTQFNYVSSIYPAGSTLTNSGLENTLTGSASAAGADLVSLPDGLGSFNTYFFNPGGFGAAATWSEITASGNVDVDGDAIELTPGMIITNRGDAQNATTFAPDFFSNL